MTVPAWGTPRTPEPTGPTFLVVGGFELTDECYAEVVEAPSAQEAELRVAAEQGPRRDSFGNSAGFFVNGVVQIVDGVPLAVDSYDPKIRRYH